MAFTNIPPNLQDIFYSITDRISKLETGPSQAMEYAQSAQSTAISSQSVATDAQAQAIAAQMTALGASAQALVAQSTASFAQSLAYAASSQATIAQTTANGKNKVYYSTGTPGSTANTAGDIWFQYSGSGLIIGQYVGLGGTSWQQQTVTQAVIGNLDAGKITTGTLSAITIDAGTGGNAFHVTAGGIMSAQGAYIKGTVVATSGVFTGQIQATTGYFGGASDYWSIGSSGITGIGSATITAGAISGSTITGGTVQTSSGSTSVSMDSTYNALRFKNSGSYVGAIVPLSSNGIIMHYGSTPDGTGGTRPQMYVGSTVVSLQADTSNIVSASTAGVSLTGSTNLNGSTYAVGNRTGTTSTANTYFNSSTGYWTYTTSSQRYKVEIQPQDIPLDSILALQPKSYIDKNEYEENGNKSDGLQRLLGLIAEDVIQIPVIGEMLANRNEEGQPESVNYDRVAIALIPLLKDLNDRITKLEGK